MPQKHPLCSEKDNKNPSDLIELASFTKIFILETKLLSRYEHEY